MSELSKSVEKNGCLIRFSLDHRVAQLVPPTGKPLDFVTTKNATAFYQAEQASREYRAADEAGLRLFLLYDNEEEFVVCARDGADAILVLGDHIGEGELIHKVVELATRPICARAFIGRGTPGTYIKPQRVSHEVRSV